ncbi:hypothetical protein [Streptomyces sp. NPDC001083]|uniref:hypothetical protein n=1 Tax=Streptomyces sp. NPDC001083 TaxID=3364545 RepID=UPI0036760D78
MHRTNPDPHRRPTPAALLDHHGAGRRLLHQSNQRDPALPFRQHAADNSDANDQKHHEPSAVIRNHSTHSTCRFGTDSRQKFHTLLSNESA